MEIKYIEETTLEDRLKYLPENSNEFWSFYMIAFVNKAYKQNDFEKYFKDYKDIGRFGLEDNKIVQQLFDSVMQRRNVEYFRYYRDDEGASFKFWDVFYEDEKKQAELLKEKSDQLYSYFNFLVMSDVKIKNISFFFYNNSYKNKKSNIDFKNYATPKIGSDFINIDTYQKTFYTVFIDIDKLYYESLLQNKIPNSVEVIEIINKSLDLQELASPIIFIEYPKELVVYKKLIKNWLLMEVEKRKRQFMWEEGYIPMPYLEITKFANRLLDPAERDYLIKDSPEYFQYPKHIFSGYKGYKLFKYYSKGIYNQTMLTFIYRNMRSNEREEYKILADPAPFLEWYNSQREHDNIFQINQPLSKVNSKERQQNYKIIKSLIEELYPTT
ncbi:hypothetical protein [Croceibacter atlanticus]|uniref:Uncharacterized protein n=1 Tax=Croceibacter atlanticus (strain ATCC BAA-628 / JCM 21780 / CIP 108009 / IAM 15332 / KCTC 12090 / HTCC2559) TaxID=216432 RepID=A3UAX0_CROAH|nr:hypothetical protein [Croceibacter atlanticus]EAP86956.1 hypothetical protein CA2559_12988 [Croceibacter atlanticus HTCC2559]